MAIQSIAPITIRGDFGTTTTVPFDQASTYALTRAEQLKTLSRLVHDATAGFAIEISGNDVFALSGLANELAIANAELTSLLAKIADEDAESRKGGAV